MAYLAVNKDGKEVRFDGNHKPFRWNGKWLQPSDKVVYVDDVGRGLCEAFFGKTVPFGTIIAMTGQKITFEDEPIKI